MKKKTLVIVLSFILLISLSVASYYLTLGMGREKIKIFPAEMFVNGQRLEDQASMYWYWKAHEGAARAQCPFFSTLESLGCVIMGDDQRETAEIVIHAGDQEFTLMVAGYNSSLYKDGLLLVGNAANRGQYHGGVLYLDAEKAEEVLSALGFEHITCVVNDEAMTITLSAESNWK